MKDWESTPTDLDNFEKWTVRRYWETRNRYMLSARHELGYQLTEYCDKGRWDGGSEVENRAYEQLQDFYVSQGVTGIKITRNRLREGVALFEVTQEGTPRCSMLLVHARKHIADARHNKDHYAYHYGGLTL